MAILEPLPPNPYKALDIPETAQVDVIKKKYRELILKCHPDKVPEAEKAEATNRFAAVQNAWEILGDAGKRGKYHELVQQHKQAEELARHQSARAPPAGFYSPNAAAYSPPTSHGFSRAGPTKQRYTYRESPSFSSPQPSPGHDYYEQTEVRSSRENRKASVYEEEGNSSRERVDRMKAREKERTRDRDPVKEKERDWDGYREAKDRDSYREPSYREDREERDRRERKLEKDRQSKARERAEKASKREEEERREKKRRDDERAARKEEKRVEEARRKQLEEQERREKEERRERRRRENERREREEELRKEELRKQELKKEEEEKRRKKEERRQAKLEDELRQQKEMEALRQKIRDQAQKPSVSIEEIDSLEADLSKMETSKKERSDRSRDRDSGHRERSSRSKHHSSGSGGSARAAYVEEPSSSYEQKNLLQGTRAGDNYDYARQYVYNTAGLPSGGGSGGRVPTLGRAHTMKPDLEAYVASSGAGGRSSKLHRSQTMGVSPGHRMSSFDGDYDAHGGSFSSAYVDVGSRFQAKVRHIDPSHVSTSLYAEPAMGSYGTETAKFSDWNVPLQDRSRFRGDYRY